MFDISFFELLMIAVVGLVVIGPDKLPGAIRTTGLWLGRIKRTIGETRREVERQLGADEIRRELHNEQVMRNLEKMRHVHKDLQTKIHKLEQGANKSILAPDTDAKPGAEAAAHDPKRTPPPTPTETTATGISKTTEDSLTKDTLTEQAQPEPADAPKPGRADKEATSPDSKP